jgi:hypothetical protein
VQRSRIISWKELSARAPMMLSLKHTEKVSESISDR